MADEPADNDSPTRGQEGPTSDGECIEESKGGVEDAARRSFLKAGAAAAAVGAMGTASAQSGDVVDIVEAGADPNGNEPIDGVLESVVGDGVVVEFPSDGEFVMNGTNLNANNFELRGNGARLYPEGGFIEIRGYGWTMDGFEIDMRSDWTYPSMDLHGGDYTLSRCIWRGLAGSGDGRALRIRFDTGTVNRIVDCYWPDGAVEGNEESNFGCIGSFLNWENDGLLRLERCWFEGWSKDTTYLSEMTGTLEMVDCYMRNTIVGPRISGGTLKRVKSVHTDPIPIEKWSGSSFQSGAWLNGQKGIYGEVLIEDCDFYITGPQSDTPVKGKVMPGPTTIRDTRIHSNVSYQSVWLDGDDIWLDNVSISGQQNIVLDGNVQQRDVNFVDTEAADPSPHIPKPPADGSIPGGDSPSLTEPEPLSNDLEVRGTGTTTEYAIEVTQKLQPVSSTIEQWDDVSETSATGWITDSTQVDQFTFDGELASLEFLEGEAEVYVNGEQVNATGQEPLANEIEIRGTGTQAEYSFTVSDTVRPVSDTLQDGDAVSDDGTSASGTVSASGSDSYTFDGDVSEFVFSVGSAEVYVNGERTDLGSATAMPNTLEIEGTGTTTEYTFEVSKDLAPLADTLQDWDEVSGSSANGWVTEPEHTDAFTYSGEISSFEFPQGEATVYVNGEQVDPTADQLLENTIEIRATGSEADYAFTVAEKCVPKSASLETGDGVSDDGTSATGTVSGEEADVYTFSSDVTSFEFTSGSGEVYVNGSLTQLGAATPTLENSLEIRGTGVVTHYNFTVSGELQGDDETLQSWDDVSGSSATGWVTTESQADVFAFNGEITAFEFLEGEAEVYVNGQQVDPTTDDGSTSETELRIEGTGTTTQYAFEVTDTLSPVSDTIEKWDDVTETSATGWVTSESQADVFTYTGDIASFEFLEGEANVYLDGQQVDPSTLG